MSEKNPYKYNGDSLVVENKLIKIILNQFI